MGYHSLQPDLCIRHKRSVGRFCADNKLADDQMSRIFFDGYIDGAFWDNLEDDYVWMYVLGQEISSSIKALAGRGALGFAELFERGEYPAKWSVARCHRLTAREEPVTFPAQVIEQFLGVFDLNKGNEAGPSPSTSPSGYRRADAAPKGSPAPARPPVAGAEPIS